MNRHAGFTLLELVIAISISVLVIGLVAMMMTTPVDAYTAQSRRAELSDSAAALTRRIGNDLRSALPNSVRIGNFGSVAVLEFIPVADTLVYRPDGTMAGNVAQELTLLAPDAQFSVIGMTDAARPRADRPFPTTGFFVLNNLGIPGADAYQGVGVITPPGTGITVATPVPPVDGEDVITLAPAFQFTGGSPTSRLYRVSWPVAYICDSARNTLRRFSNYALTATLPANENASQLNGGGVVNSLLARNVASCRFQCPSGAPPTCSNLLTLDMSVSIAVPGGSESMRVLQQYPVGTTP